MSREPPEQLPWRSSQCPPPREYCDSPPDEKKDTGRSVCQIAHQSERIRTPRPDRRRKGPAARTRQNNWQGRDQPAAGQQSRVRRHHRRIRPALRLSRRRRCLVLRGEVDRMEKTRCMAAKIPASPRGLCPSMFDGTKTHPSQTLAGERLTLSLGRLGVTT